MRFASLSLILAIGSISPTAAGALPIGANQVPGGATLIDFESIRAREEVTTQFLGQGVTFSGGLFGRNFRGNSIQGSQEAHNFFTSSATISNPITVSFSTQQATIGLLVGGTIGQTSSILLQAFRAGDLVDEFTFTASTTLPGGNLRSTFAGLSVAGGFDTVEVSRITGNGAFAIDDMRFSSQVVPEPATGTLLSLGFAALGAWRQPLRQRHG